jgi:biopolymer transport protein ExbD
MRIDGPVRVTRPIPLTPLVDVVFLLLMFFMLSTTFAKYGQLGMGPGGEEGTSQAAVAPPVAEAPGVVVDVFQGPVVRINGTPLALHGLVAALDTLHERGITSGIIRARMGATVQDLVLVLERARNSTLPVLSLSAR